MYNQNFQDEYYMHEFWGEQLLRTHRAIAWVYVRLIYKMEAIFSTPISRNFFEEQFLRTDKATECK